MDFDEQRLHDRGISTDGESSEERQSCGIASTLSAYLVEVAVAVALTPTSTPTPTPTSTLTPTPMSTPTSRRGFVTNDETPALMSTRPEFATNDESLAILANIAASPVVDIGILVCRVHYVSDAARPDAS
jgi:hypothetical protein